MQYGNKAIAWLFAILAVFVPSLGSAQQVGINFESATTAARDSLVNTLATVFPILMGLLAITLGARWVFRWLKRTG